MIWKPNLRPAFCHLLCLELKVRFGDGGKKEDLAIGARGCRENKRTSDRKF